MSEKNKESLFQKQKEARPKIEDVIGDVLDGDRRKNALDFVAYLRANKMNPQWASANSWKVSYQSQGVCYIRVHGTAHYHNLEAGSWHINYIGEIGSEYESFISHDKIKEIAWANVKYCTNCSSCGPGHHVMFLGREFDKVCHRYIVIKNPDAEALDYAKKLVEANRYVMCIQSQVFFA